MLEDYFSLQLKLAARYSIAADVPFCAAIEHCTNLRRRLNLWGPAGASRWTAFLAEVRRLGQDDAAALSLCIAWHEARPHQETSRSFGCFSFDPPDSAGTLRLHFMPSEGTQTSPLASPNVDARVRELRALFLHVRRTEGTAACVRGISWLYNLEAYRRLFPPSYSASVRTPWFPLHLNGSSTWGQVLNWRQEVKPTVRDAVLARLPTMKRDAPWEVFPCKALVATGRIDAFYELFT